MIGRFDTSRVIKKAIRVALLLGAGAAVSAVAFCEFGFVFNFTHSAPFGIYRQAAEPTVATRKNSPYAFFCPDQRWPGLRRQPEYSPKSGHLSRRLRSALEAGCRVAGRHSDNFASGSHRQRNTGSEFLATHPRFTRQRTPPISIRDL